MKKTILIQGMHCTSCSLLIQKRLVKQPWVSEATVNYTTWKASVVFDEAMISWTALEMIIQETWYEVVKGDENTISQTQRSNEEAKERYNRMISALLLSIPLFLFMIYDLVRGFQFGELALMPWSWLISLLVTIPIQFWIWKNFLKSAWSELRMMTFGMATLISLWTLVAFFFSLWMYRLFFRDTWTVLGLNSMKVPWLYFEVAWLLITFVTFWKRLEARAKASTSSAVEKLITLTPLIAHRLEGETVIDISIQDVQLTDTLLVKPWESIPVDGKIIQWTPTLDESLLTGESMPANKTMNDTVYAGTLNGMTSFQLVPTSIGDKTLLAQIIKLVDDAQSSKAPLQSIADRLSQFFVPTVLGIAVITFFVRRLIQGVSFETALLYATAVIVISCPCALWLATPTALMVATGWGAKKWILIKWGEPLQLLWSIDVIITDKTGTITQWKPMVTNIAVCSASYDENTLLQIMMSAEQQSEHPLAHALITEATNRWLPALVVEEISVIAWKWISGKIANQSFFVGTFPLDIHLACSSEAEQRAGEWKTLIGLRIEDEWIGVVAVADVIKETAPEAIRLLQARGIHVVMATGDTLSTATAIGKQVGITDIHARVLPADKVALVKQYQETWKRVAMIGDGINDSPALSQADVGIVMKSGADVALEAWSVVIMNNDLMSVVHALSLSKASTLKIYQNLFFAFFYNLAGIPLAAWLWASWWIMLKPEFAWLAMALSSVSVVLNALSLKLYDHTRSWLVNRVLPVVLLWFFVLLFREWIFLSWYGALQRGKPIPVANWSLLPVYDGMKQMPTKVTFTDTWVPKLFGYLALSEQFPKRLIENVTSDSSVDMYIGYMEAQMMWHEWLFTNIGDRLQNFFGIPEVRIAGVLAPTKTFIDEMHFFVNQETYNQVAWTENVSFDTTPTNELKVFYLYGTGEWIYPQKLWTPPTQWNEWYTTMMMWFSEARMMRNEKLYTNVGDRLDGFFWQDVQIWDNLSKTVTALDMMHYLPWNWQE
jgi:P-type Cu+ transporter